MSASSEAYADYMDDYGDSENDSIVEGFIESAVKDIEKAHGTEIAEAVETLLNEHIAPDLYEEILGDDIYVNVYTLPGVSKLIESMTDYASA